MSVGRQLWLNPLLQLSAPVNGALNRWLSVLMPFVGGWVLRAGCLEVSLFFLLSTSLDCGLCCSVFFNTSGSLGIWNSWRLVPFWGPLGFVLAVLSVCFRIHPSGSYPGSSACWDPPTEVFEVLLLEALLTLLSQFLVSSFWWNLQSLWLSQHACAFKPYSVP